MTYKQMPMYEAYLAANDLADWFFSEEGKKVIRLELKIDNGKGEEIGVGGWCRDSFINQTAKILMGRKPNC